jgi:hypothetical protein
MEEVVMTRVQRILGCALLGLGCAAVLAPVGLAQLTGYQAGWQKPARPVSGSTTTPPTITREQVERLEARIAAAQRLVGRFEHEAKRRGRADGWRQATLEALLPLSLPALQQVEQQAVDVDAMSRAVADVLGEPPNLGDTDEDLVYTPITPCRFLDTRNVGGKISGNRGFDVDLNGATYGGAASCHLPTLFGSGLVPIGALAMNVTIVDTSTAGAPGFVALKPSPLSPTSSLLNWYEAGGSVQVANLGVVSLFQNVFVAQPEEFFIQTSGAVHVIADVFGAFIAPRATALQQVRVEATGDVAAGTSGIVVAPACPASYTLTGGGCYTQHTNHLVEATYPSGAQWTCWGRNNTALTSELTTYGVCARVPGR